MLVQIRRVCLFLVVVFFILLALPSTAYAKKSSKRKKAKLTTTSVSLKENDTFKLKVKNKGNKQVKWSTTNPSVASVTKEGMILAKKEGKCKIKAKVGGKTLTCKVEVDAIGEIAPQETIDEIVALINKERVAQGKSKVVADTTLCEVAQLRAYDLTEVFSHTRPNGDNCFELLAEYDYEYSAVGENIAAGQKCEAEVMTDWLNSPGHRRNIMNKKYTKVGIGLVKDEDSKYGYYWVQIFAN